MTNPGPSVRMRTAALILLAAVQLAACGIAAEDQPRTLPTGTASATAEPPTTAPPTPATFQLTLWFVREGQLVPVSRTASEPPDSQDYLDLLAAGPTEAEEGAGVRSALLSVVTGEPLVVTAQQAEVAVSGLRPDQVAIVLQPEFKEVIAEEQIIVLGEVVSTVAVGAISEVVFVDTQGQVLGVPAADGRLVNGPVQPQDYAALKA